MWLDSNVGLYYVRARVYDAGVGRFLSNDPAEGRRAAPESFEVGRFVRGRPSVGRDPQGRSTLMGTFQANLAQAALANTAMATIRLIIRYCNGQRVDPATFLLEMENVLFATLSTATDSTLSSGLGLRGTRLAIGGAFLLNITYPLLARWASGEPSTRQWLADTVNHAHGGAIVAAGLDPVDADKRGGGRSPRNDSHDHHRRLLGDSECWRLGDRGMERCR